MTAKEYTEALAFAESLANDIQTRCLATAFYWSTEVAALELSLVVDADVERSLRECLSEERAKVVAAERERDRRLNELSSAIDNGKAAGVAEERARVNGWWRAWLRPPAGRTITAGERDEGIATGAPVPGERK